MKWHYLTKLSLGLGGATLIALSISPRVQAAELKVGFLDRSGLYGLPNPISVGFEGEFVWNSSQSGTGAISSWNWRIIDRSKRKVYQLQANQIESVSYDGDNLTLELGTHWPQAVFLQGVQPTQLKFTFGGLGDAVTGVTPNGSFFYGTYAFYTGLAELKTAQNSEQWQEWDELNWSAETVPEPTTIGASLLALGFLGAKKLSKRRQQTLKNSTD